MNRFNLVSSLGYTALLHSNGADCLNIFSANDPENRLQEAAHAVIYGAKTIEFVTRLKVGSQPVETDSKTFNRLNNYIGTGNVVSNVQLSTVVRARSKLNCNGVDFPAGHLQKFDLGIFKALPSKWLNAIARAVESNVNFETQDHMIYVIRHPTAGASNCVYHGILITDMQHRLVTEIHRSSIDGFNSKSQSVMDMAKLLLTDQGIQTRTCVMETIDGKSVFHDAELEAAVIALRDKAG